MDEVTVKKAELLERLKSNRTSHAQLFKDAQEGFLVDSEKRLAKALKNTKAGKVPESISFTAPVDRTDLYDEAIELLEMSVGDEVTISRHEFTQYVQDKWIQPRERQMLRAMALSSSNSAAYL